MQLSMARLEEVFRHILLRNTIPLDPGRLAAAIDATELFYDEVNGNIDDVSSGGIGGISFDGDDKVSLDLIHLEAVIDLREIGDQMIRSGYEKECCQAYCSVRRDVLDKRLVILGVEKLSIEEVLRMEWRLLNDKIKRWIPAFRYVVRGLLSDEKRLCDQIFTGSDLIKEVCFSETCKGCVMQFLNFGEAVAVGRRSAEKLFRILDMYDALAAVLPHLQALFMDEDAGDMVCSEANGVLDSLGEAAIGTFVEFENAVQGEAYKEPMQNGEIHPLTRYVMDYTKVLVDYSDTLNSLLETVEDSSGLEKEKTDNLDTTVSLFAQRLLALITSLESNLEEISRMYEDDARQYIFLMNNILYIVQKVKDSELRNALGDNWIKKRRGYVMQFLNFGEEVAVGRRSAEILFRILDMHNALAAVLPDLQAIFMDEDAGDMVFSEAKGVLDALGEAAIGTFVEFENAVQGEASKEPIQNGDIHPLTRYVMNYTKVLVDYSDTLNSLLETVEDSSGLEKEENDNLETSMSLIAQRLLALITSLESNLEEISRMYDDDAMQYIFLMNNIFYIVQKVKDSELRNALGDNWIKKRKGLIRQHATHYLRAAWTKVLSCLKDEGIGGSSSSVAKVALKERFKNFNICFEDIYRIQTAWKVPDPHLREELRISILEKVIPSYRSFLGRFGSKLQSWRHAGKYIKYSPEDLEDYLLDLFEGTSLIMHHMKRKST